MSQPEWNKGTTRRDVLIVFKLTNKESPPAHAVHLFSLGQTIHQPIPVTWEGVSLKGTYWGTAIKMSPLRHTFGNKRQAKITFPSITIEIGASGKVDEDEFYALMGDLSDDNLTSGLSYVGIFVVQKDTAPDPNTDLYFVGLLDRESANLSIDKRILKIKATDRAKQDLEKRPVEVFTIEDYPNLDPAWKNKPFPILWGDYDTDEFPGVEIVCIDTDNSGENNLKYKLCQPMQWGIKQFSSGGNAIKRVGPGGTFLEGASAYDVLNGDLITGEFWAMESGVADDEPAWQKGETAFIFEPQGNVNPQSALIDNPVAIIKYLLTEYGGVSANYIDSSSYATAFSIVNGKGYTARRRIIDETKIADLVDSLCSEYGIFLYVHNGLYKFGLNTFYYDLPPPDLTLWPCDFLKKEIKYSKDPGEWCVNAIKFRYDYNINYLGADGLDYREQYIKDPDSTEDFTEILNQWIYQSATAQSIANQLYGALSEAVGHVEATVIKRMMQNEMGDIIEMVYPGIYLEADFQIFERQIDFDKCTTHFKGYCKDQ